MRFTHGVHVLFEGHPILILRQLTGYEPMIPIPGIHPLDRVHPLNGVDPPIPAFFYEEGLNHPLNIASRNHDEMTTRTPCLSFYDGFYFKKSQGLHVIKAWRLTLDCPPSGRASTSSWSSCLITRFNCWATFWSFITKLSQLHCPKKS